jgi:hypothetical protein
VEQKATSNKLDCCLGIILEQYWKVGSSWWSS